MHSVGKIATASGMPPSNYEIPLEWLRGKNHSANTASNAIL